MKNSYDTIDPDKRIKVASSENFYFGDEKKGIVDATVIESDIGTSFIVAELEQVSYEELLQRSFKNAYERNPNYFEEDRITCFLYWCDNILFEIGTFEWSYTEKDEKILYLSHFFYTEMTKYQDVINETVFDRPSKILVTNTTRPVVVKIINHIKKNSA